MKNLNIKIKNSLIVYFKAGCIAYPHLFAGCIAYPRFL